MAGQKIEWIRKNLKVSAQIDESRGDSVGERDQERPLPEIA
jgi:hypothetical protein